MEILHLDDIKFLGASPIPVFKGLKQTSGKQTNKKQTKNPKTITNTIVVMAEFQMQDGTA